MHFARVLRAAGLPVGPAKVIAALDAVEAVGIENREDFRAALQSVFIERHEQQALFDQAFELFWRNPRLLERMLQLLLPRVYGRVSARRRRSAAAGAARRGAGAAETIAATGRSRGAGDRARCRVDVFAARSAAGQGFRIDERRRAGAGQGDDRAPAPAVARITDTTHRGRGSRARRSTCAPRLRAMASARGAVVPLAWRQRRRRRPPLVVLCDISGSMDRYSRMLLFFLHAITNDRDRVHVLLFGTRLTNITRHLRHRDVDVAIARVSASVSGLGRRHAHRRLPRGVQPPLVAPAARAGRDRAAHQRRPRQRRRRRTGAGDGSTAQVLPPADLAQSAAALRGLRGRGRPASAPCCRTSTSSCRCIIWKASSSWRARSRGAHSRAVARHRCPGRRKHRNDIGGQPIMEMNGSRDVPASVEPTWNALNDPEVLKACIAGCESIEQGVRQRIHGCDDGARRAGVGESSTAASC